MYKQDASSLSTAVAEQQILILARQQAQREEELAQSQRHILALQEEIEELERGNRLYSQQDDLRHYQPNYIVSVPLVYETLYSGIQKQISTSSKARKHIALSFLRISLAYMEFKRIYEWTYLTRNQKQPSYYASLADWLWARIVAALLWPLHVLGTKLVYKLLGYQRLASVEEVVCHHMLINFLRQLA